MAHHIISFAVEWSGDEKFLELDGYRELTDLSKLEATIWGLTSGKAYYSRVSAGNAKGYSTYCTSSSAVPSSKTPFLSFSWSLRLALLHRTSPYFYFSLALRLA